MRVNRTAIWVAVLLFASLGALATERGDKEEAQRQWGAVLAECPGDREAVRHLHGGAGSSG